MQTAMELDVFAALVQAMPASVFITDETIHPRFANAVAIEQFGPLEAIGTIDSLFESPHDEAIRQVHANPGSETPFVIRKRNGRKVVHRCIAVAFSDHGKSLVAFIMPDVTDQLRSSREAEALARLAAATTFAGTLDSTMDKLAEAVVCATGSDACSVTMIERDPLRVRFLGTSGLPPGYAKEFERIWLADDPRRQLEEYVKAERVVTVGARQALLQDPRWSALHHHLQGVSWDTVVSSPLQYRGRLLGSLNCYYEPGHEVAEDETRFMQAIADQAAGAVENARLFLEVQEKAVLEERQRLARELHDSVSQALYGIGLGARTALVHLERSPQRAEEPLTYVLSLAEGALAEMRALIFELRPDDLDREGLVAALRRHIAALRVRYGLTVHEDLGDDPQMAPATRLALYRIGQEALHNVARHAQAREVHVSMTQVENGINLEVVDDGIGFDPSELFPGHLGLRSMRERAERLGGRFSIKSASGKGTHVTARVPVIKAQ